MLWPCRMNQALAALQKGWGTYIPFVPLQMWTPPSIFGWLVSAAEDFLEGSCQGLLLSFLIFSMMLLMTVPSLHKEPKFNSVCGREVSQIFWTSMWLPIYFIPALTTVQTCYDDLKEASFFSRCKTLHSATAGIQMVFHMSDITGFKVHCCIYKKQHWH